MGLVFPSSPENPSMGLVSLPAWMVDFDGINVGKYTSPMDAMGVINGVITHAN